MIQKALPGLFLLLYISASLASLVDERISEERSNYHRSFAILPHKPNYILPLTYQHKRNRESTDSINADMQHAEIKFQLSLKVPVTDRTLFDGNGFIYLSYTARSLWQAYNTSESSPFRDTNHEPEVFINFTTPFDWQGLRIPLISTGFSHQSNGRGGNLSRGWNRIYLDTIVSYKDWYISFKPWYRIPEREKRDEDDAKGDDNPDIHQYYGHFELRAFRAIGDNQLSFMLRRNLKNSSRGALEINYSYPFNNQVQGYVQFFHGYGETLLDYDFRNTRIGFGFMFSNWL